ncbi:MAG: signal peptidase II [Candidatus Magasanikbacteria bacterium]|nr:signal peptidase II [Candidatus Magasanikbacteria bacterium]
MTHKIHVTVSLLVCGFFLFLDQLLKYIVRHTQESTYYLLKPWIGWEYFENPGIAFGIPVPQFLIIFLTPIIIILLIVWWMKKTDKNILFYLGTSLIIAGAISNLIDRMLFSFTVDYLRVFTSVMNVADMMIVMGAGLLVVEEVKKNKK